MIHSRRNSYDVCAGVTLTDQVERPSLQTGEDLHQVGEEIHLNSDSSQLRILEYLAEKINKVLAHLVLVSD